MAMVILPSTLASRVGGRREIEAEGARVAEVLGDLERRHPELRGWALDERGRIRRHVHVFVGSQQAGLETPVATRDEVYVVQAISGGAGDGGDGDELLVGTRKGLFVVRGARDDEPTIAGRVFAGQEVYHATRDPRSGRYFAAVTHGQFGPHLYHADDPLGEWREVEGLAFPDDVDVALEGIWAIQPGGADDGVLWAGVAPAALFKSVDGGRSWSLDRAFWEIPERPRWEAGGAGLILHAICPWPGDGDRLAVGSSAAGVWLTDDGGASWRRGGRGIVSRYLPEAAREKSTSCCVHAMARAPLEPATLYLQFHRGVYRSDDGGETWVDVGTASGLPSDFGFPLAIDPKDPDRAFVIPLASDEDRVMPGGELRVYETRDRGASWRSASDGLPRRDAYLTVLRHAFCHHGDDPLALVFGTTGGQLYGRTGDAPWRPLAEHLPPILSVRAGG